MHCTTRRAAIVASLVGCLLGCGDSGPFELMPVHGTITYDDGTPIPAGGLVLQFDPIGVQPVKGMVPRTANAPVDAQGVFVGVTSLKFNDGLIPGKHKVAIQFAQDAQGNLLVPKEYTHLMTTPLEIDTGDGTIEIKVPKP